MYPRQRPMTPEERWFLPFGIAAFLVAAAVVTYAFSLQVNLPADVAAVYRRSAALCAVIAAAILSGQWIWRRVMN